MWPIASARSHAVPMALASVSVPSTRSLKRLLANDNVSAKTERQQAEHTADHDTDTFGLNLSSACSAVGAEPMTGLMCQHLGNPQQQAKSENAPAGDRRELGHC